MVKKNLSSLENCFALSKLVSSVEHQFNTLGCLYFMVHVSRSLGPAFGKWWYHLPEDIWGPNCFFHPLEMAGLIATVLSKQHCIADPLRIKGEEGQSPVRELLRKKFI